MYHVIPSGDENGWEHIEMVTTDLDEAMNYARDNGFWDIVTVVGHRRDKWGSTLNVKTSYVSRPWQREPYWETVCYPTEFNAEAETLVEAIKNHKVAINLL